MAPGANERIDPSFGDAPTSVSTSGKVSGPLKGPTKGYRGLSKRAKAAAIGSVGFILLMIVLGITSMPDHEETSAALKRKQEEEKAADEAKRLGPKSTVPTYVTDAGGGVSRAGEEGAAPAGGMAPAPAVPGLGSSSSAGTDPLASAGRRPAGQATAPSQQSGQALSIEEQEAQQERLARLQALREARNADLADSNAQLSQQQSDSSASSRNVVPPLVGGAPGAAGQNLQGMGNGQQDDQNKQQRKEAFLGGAVGMAGAVPATYLPATVQRPRSPYQIEAGWLIPAMMDSQMVSDLPGTLRAHVSQNVMDSATGRFVLIPGGSRLVGHYDSQIAFGQERVLVVWDLLKFPDGSELPLMGMQAVDQVGAAGLTGDVDNHMWTVVKAAVFMSVITAGAQLSQPQSRQSNGTNQAPSVNETMAAQLGTQLGQVSGNMVNKYLNIQPSIKTEQGTRFNILVKQNVVFDQPWSWN